jgi:DNA repair exonuclease SbcCD ATPase subunit
MPQVNFTIDSSIINRLDVEAKRRSTRTGKPLSRSSLVAKILDEHFKGVRILDTEFEDLKKELADKEAALSGLRNQEAAIIGLQNEAETLRTQVKTLEEKLAIYTGFNNDLKADKETLQKQLELVTLRLPPPRVGFWSRIFGSKKEKQND